MSLSKPPVVTQKPYWPKVQAPATLDQTTVSQDAWYVLLNTTTNVEISAVKIWQTNAESAAKSLRAKLTIDGQVFQSSLTSCSHNTGYWVRFDAAQTPVIGTAEVNISKYGLLRAQSIKIEIQFGDVPGTGQALYGRCAYRKLEEATV